MMFTLKNLCWLFLKKKTLEAKSDKSLLTLSTAKDKTEFWDDNCKMTNSQKNEEAIPARDSC